MRGLGHQSHNRKIGDEAVQDLELQNLTCSDVPVQVQDGSSKICDAAHLSISDMDGNREQDPISPIPRVTRRSSKWKAPVPEIIKDMMTGDESRGDVERNGKEIPTSPIPRATRRSSKRKAPVPEIAKDMMPGDESRGSDGVKSVAHPENCHASSNDEPPRKRSKQRGGQAVHEGGVLTRAATKRQALFAKSLEDMMKGVHLNVSQAVADGADETPPVVTRARSKRKAPATDIIEELMSEVHLTGIQECEDAGSETGSAGNSRGVRIGSKKLKKSVASEGEEATPVGVVTRSRSKSLGSALGIIGELISEEQVDESQRSVERSEEKVSSVGIVTCVRTEVKAFAIETIQEIIQEEQLDRSHESEQGEQGTSSTVGASGSDTLGNASAIVPFQSPEECSEQGKRGAGDGILANAKAIVPFQGRRKCMNITSISSSVVCARISSRLERLPTENIDNEVVPTQEGSEGLVRKARYVVRKDRIFRRRKAASIDSGPGNGEVECLADGLQKGEGLIQKAGHVLRRDRFFRRRKAALIGSGPGNGEVECLTDGQKKDVWTYCRPFDIKREFLKDINGTW